VRLTPSQAADKLGITPATLTKWARAGKVPFSRVAGGHRRYDLDEIDRLAATRIEREEPRRG